MEPILQKELEKYKYELLIREFQEQNEWARLALKSIDDIEKLYFTVVSAVVGAIGYLNYLTYKTYEEALRRGTTYYALPLIVIIALVTSAIIVFLILIGRKFEKKSEKMYRDFLEHLSVIVQIRKVFGIIQVKGEEIEGLVTYPKRWRDHWKILFNEGVEEFIKVRSEGIGEHKSYTAYRKKSIHEIVGLTNRMLILLLLIYILFIIALYLLKINFVS